MKMKRLAILVSVALMSTLAFVSCADDSPLYVPDDEFIAPDDDDYYYNDSYDFFVYYKGQKIYFMINDAADNECYVTYGDDDDWIITDEEANEGYYAYYDGVVEIPSQVTYDGVIYNVTGIGKYAFYGTNLTSVTIPSTVTYIEDEAFGYSLLTSIIIPSSVEYIGKNVFESCYDLEEIIVEDGNPYYTAIDGVLYTKM